jgi:hypothetical protein
MLTKLMLAAALFVLGPICSLARGADLPKPSGSVILTITGSIQSTNSSEGAVFDREMIESVGIKTLRTSTNWTDGVKVFEGVLMRDLMASVGAQGSIITALALNDYTVEIPMTDMARYDMLLAFRMDGKDLVTRDKGPLWVVYPRDQESTLRNAQHDSRWIWQLTALTVR